MRVALTILASLALCGCSDPQPVIEPRPVPPSGPATVGGTITVDSPELVLRGTPEGPAIYPELLGPLAFGIFPRNEAAEADEGVRLATAWRDHQSYSLTRTAARLYTMQFDFLNLPTGDHSLARYYGPEGIASATGWEPGRYVELQSARLAAGQNPPLTGHIQLNTGDIRARGKLKLNGDHTAAEAALVLKGLHSRTWKVALDRDSFGRSWFVVDGVQPEDYGLSLDGSQVGIDGGSVFGSRFMSSRYDFDFGSLEAGELHGELISPWLRSDDPALSGDRNLDRGRIDAVIRVTVARDWEDLDLVVYAESVAPSAGRHYAWVHLPSGSSSTYAGLGERIQLQNLPVGEYRVSVLRLPAEGEGMPRELTAGTAAIVPGEQQTNVGQHGQQHVFWHQPLGRVTLEVDPHEGL